jgi:hypothetical protein
MRTLDFIKWVFGTSMLGKKDDKMGRRNGRGRTFDSPHARAAGNHLRLLYQRGRRSKYQNKYQEGGTWFSETIVPV